MSQPYVLSDFTMERADPDTHNWCWVAVAVSVGNFYDTGPWTQCKVANTVLGQARGSTTDCCDPSHRIEPSCDTPWDLDVALRYTLSRDQMIPTPVDIGQVRNVINERRPLGFLVEFRQGGHYAAIVGYDDEADSSGVPVVHVLDPNLGMSVITSEIETLGARFGGRWTRSYYTRKGGT